MQALVEWVFKVRFLRSGSSDEKSLLKLGADHSKMQQKEFQRKCILKKKLYAATPGNAAVVQAGTCG